MGKFCREFANDIKERVSMKDIAEYYGFKPNARGFICCPFHHEKTPSLKLFDGTRGWHCYGCGEGGDIFDFVARYFDLGFQQSVSKVNTDFNLGFPLEQPTKEELEKARAKATAFNLRRARERKEYRELLNEYITALEWYTVLDRIKIEYKPADGEVNDMYAFACLNIDDASYSLDVAEGKLREHELRTRT